MNSDLPNLIFPHLPLKSHIRNVISASHKFSWNCSPHWLLSATHMLLVTVTCGKRAFGCFSMRHFFPRSFELKNMFYTTSPRSFRHKAFWMDMFMSCILFSSQQRISRLRSEWIGKICHGIRFLVTIDRFGDAKVFQQRVESAEMTGKKNQRSAYTHTVFLSQYTRRPGERLSRRALIAKREMRRTHT